MSRIAVNPALITWARERAGVDGLALSKRFPKIGQWERGDVQPTLKQLEAFAHAVHVPIGFLFLPQPPQEALPVPDFRTLADQRRTRPSPDLLDTLYLCQQRQDWFRDYARLHGLPKRTFVGSVRPGADVMRTADAIRGTLGLSVAERAQLPTWTEALRQLIAKAEEAGVLAMASSIVGSNSHRKLDVAEFRGFALADDLAPLVFINAADSKAAQMFTLAHELVHLWAGESGVSDVEAGRIPQQRVEGWCNQVAAELLAPLDAVRAELRKHAPLEEEIQRLARVFKVSSLVALRRLFDVGRIDRERLWSLYREEQDRLREIERGVTGGGDFYRTLGARTGKRFARAVLSSTLEGQTLFQDAFRMLGLRKMAAFYEAARELGVMA
ncbi:MAG: ImmA/IrrE family metallo-endopeptidase [Armatimonadota bacterium]|nr:ImmA/IrrE family metallo-endopeptidase [Armatimonadota bacterium]